MASLNTSRRSTRQPRCRLAGSGRPAARVGALPVWRVDIVRLLDAARDLKPPLRAATHETLLGLLAVSGMPVGEALHLTCEDVDLRHGVLLTLDAKFDRERLCPCMRAPLIDCGPWQVASVRATAAGPAARTGSGSRRTPV